MPIFILFIFKIFWELYILQRVFLPCPSAYILISDYASIHSETINLGYIQTWLVPKQSLRLEFNTDQQKVQEDAVTETKHTLVRSNWSDELLYHSNPKMLRSVSGEFGVEGRAWRCMRVCVRGYRWGHPEVIIHKPVSHSLYFYSYVVPFIVFSSASNIHPTLLLSSKTKLSYKSDLPRICHKVT
jgi:hypothetical protein